MNAGNSWNRKGLNGVQNALAMNILAYERLRQEIRPGISEKELLRSVENGYRQFSGFTEYQCDFISGPRAGEMEGPAAERLLHRGDALIADLLPCRDGYWCDTTRTFFVGESSEYWKKAYLTLTETLRMVEDAIFPGICAGEIYHLANQNLLKNGFPGLPHHAGHGLGTAPLQEPDFLEDSSEPLEAGMIFTLEFGIYQKGENGIRLENNYLLTEHGCVNLFPYPLDLEHFILGK